MGSVSGYGSSPYSSYINPPSASTAVPGGSAQDVSFSSSAPPAEQPKKSGGIGGFFKGIVKGAVNMVKSLCTPKGLLMAAAGVAACIAFPVAAPLVLGGMAVVGGGAQMVKGFASGNTEQAGEGFLTAGLGAVGIKASGALSAGKAAGTEGAAASEGSSWNPMNWFKSGKTAAADEAAATTPKPTAGSAADEGATTPASPKPATAVDPKVAKEAKAQAKADAAKAQAADLDAAKAAAEQAKTAAKVAKDKAAEAVKAKGSANEADAANAAEAAATAAKEAAQAAAAARTQANQHTLFGRVKNEASLEGAKANFGQFGANWTAADGVVAKAGTLPWATTPAVLSVAGPQD